MRSFAFLLILAGLNAFGQNMVIESRPNQIFIEEGNNKQIINFDFFTSNTSGDTLNLEKLKVSVFDNQNNLIQSRFLDNNGTAPSILMLPTRTWNGMTTHLIFNPFSEFEIVTQIHRLVYEWTFLTSTNEELIVESSIYPENYSQKSKLLFPLKGRILVYDAHDYTSHHRRFDYSFEPIKALGITTNFMRYAFDFVVLDDENRQFKNTGETDEDFFGFNSQVFAIAKGKVIYVSNHHKDDKQFDVSKLTENPLELYGNCVAIQHADNSVSIYGHLKENSIIVKLGDMVMMNQEIARIGVSGSSFFPHLHFEIRTSISHSAEGLPAYFEKISLLEGNLKRKLSSGLVETGNIIEIN